MKLKLEAHDLLWGMTVDCLADDAPHWVKEVLQRGDPINDMQLKCQDL
ncbi:phosphoribosyl-dephospho-CoA transferase [Acinetobacter baumannii]|nr:phosphoribosyl-dephospho-CoA transferase [Acinetobacter baumannii]